MACQFVIRQFDGSFELILPLLVRTKGGVISATILLDPFSIVMLRMCHLSGNHLPEHEMLASARGHGSNLLRGCIILLCLGMPADDEDIVGSRSHYPCDGEIQVRPYASFSPP